MQETRQIILEILRDRGQATVDDIVSELKYRRGEITAVTVRHHLNRLQESNLVNTPELRHRNTPGRPQHVYTLTEQAEAHFPTNYRQLASGILRELRNHLPSENVNVILEDVADGMVEEAQISDLPFEERLQQALQYLNAHGYEASLESCDQGYVLHTYNCPYHKLVVDSDDELCNMDMRLVSSLIGVVPRLQSRISAGDASCSYLIPCKEN